MHLSSSFVGRREVSGSVMLKISHEQVLKGKKNSIYQCYQQHKQLQNENSSHKGESSLS